jgi:hypothetical protein
VVPNVSPDDNSPFEDWWVHSDFINLDNPIFTHSKSPLDINQIEKFFLNK